MSDELNKMDEKTLFATYQCLKPCSFMEYKVIIKTWLDRSKHMKIIADRSAACPDAHYIEHHSPLLYVLQS